MNIKDIAKDLGLSKSTVSRSINNHPDVNENTKKKVNDYIEKIGYKKNIFSANISQ